MSVAEARYDPVEDIRIPHAIEAFLNDACGNSAHTARRLTITKGDAIAILNRGTDCGRHRANGFEKACNHHAEPASSRGQ